MKRFQQALKRIMVITAIVMLSGTTLSLPSTTVQAKSLKHELYQTENDELKYSKEIIREVFKTLRREMKGPLRYDEAISLIEKMSKVEVMDRYLASYGKKVDAKEIPRIVNQIYSIDLERISELGAGNQTYPDEIIQGVKESLPKWLDEEDIPSLSKLEVLDLYLASYGKKIDGPEIRRVLNQIFGINLDGISSLEGSGVSLFSKDQWISQYDQDLFVVQTGLTDVDVWIYPTDYFTAQTDLEQLPEELQNQLEKLGYRYNEEVGALYYADPDGNSVPDQFKGQTLGTLIQFIQTNYQNLS
ncbi:hypothetical protein CEH05_19705 [Halobacillus halophilus]|uniref:Uncharacterized protein n=1 Tax=Halobacillus halophilus (strain ATCC 35676 / DSM 2266 / JCM 20832 / KCTC 3685 / LMG 17431 / NBRC 102448 / NCIMB 2269) TaxID=866895 RepID=I0JT81_HALH3|nr:hypothetical protein [Halobacillus halophilus]ASF41269.1 hypothetical protein CEH05_19705 [Halobacillus halophilus]CCG47353.1 hypothetical protein HBHAL_5018 [Halobacillus halophilus DSM 2266]